MAGESDDLEESPMGAFLFLRVVERIERLERGDSWTGIAGDSRGWSGIVWTDGMGIGYVWTGSGKYRLGYSLCIALGYGGNGGTLRCELTGQDACESY